MAMCWDFGALPRKIECQERANPDDCDGWQKSQLARSRRISSSRGSWLQLCNKTRLHLTTRLGWVNVGSSTTVPFLTRDGEQPARLGVKSPESFALLRPASQSFPLLADFEVLPFLLPAFAVLLRSEAVDPLSGLENLYFARCARTQETASQKIKSLWSRSQNSVVRR